MDAFKDSTTRIDALPQNFLFGVTTAATCVEGRRPHDAALSIWDAFAGAPGRVTDNSQPADGPDHLTHWRRDLQLLSDLGINAYRLSLSWSALAGRPENLQFYDRLLDELAALDIAAVISLTHYDMPLAVMERGGWLVRETAEEFAAYAGAVAATLADRTGAWVTMNSPFVHTALGYGLGIEAPGLTLLAGALQAGQHQLLGHGMAVQALRTAGAGAVGIANAHTEVLPATESAADLLAAGRFGALFNHAFGDPLFGRPWPAELADLPGAPTADLSTSDLATIAAPLDFYGVNYYHRQRVEDAPDNLRIPFALVEPAPDEPVDEFGWPTDPGALTRTLLGLRERYPELPPIWVTENGTQDSGGLDDEHRGNYLLDHLGAIADAVAAGADVRGYFHWSLLDGWEFAEGLGRRFGLVAVDPVTRERQPKLSYRVYRDLLRRRAGRLTGRPAQQHSVAPTSSSAQVDPRRA